MAVVTVSTPAPTTPGPRRARSATTRRLAALATAAVLLVTLSGCLRLSAQMQVARDDTVSGRILVAGKGAESSTALDRLAPPSGLDQKVRITPYSADGFSGKEIYFTRLTFAELDSLSLAIDVDGTRPYTMGLRRSGDTVTFTGVVDLTSMPADRANESSTQIDLSFPNRVTDSNGSPGNGNSVNWSPKPGVVTRMQASSSYPDPATRGFAVWMIVGVGAALLVSIGAVLAARRSRATADRRLR